MFKEFDTKELNYRANRKFRSIPLTFLCVWPPLSRHRNILKRFGETLKNDNQRPCHRQSFRQNSNTSLSFNNKRINFRRLGFWFTAPVHSFPMWHFVWNSLFKSIATKRTRELLFPQPNSNPLPPINYGYTPLLKRPRSTFDYICHNAFDVYRHNRKKKLKVSAFRVGIRNYCL